jgi:tetratricopeptide (TPR) repeat protein
MTDEPSFRFPISAKPQGEEVSAEEAERRLLARLQQKECELDEAIFELAWFYSTCGRQEVSFGYVQRLLSQTTDPEKLARCYLTLGQLMEQIDDYQAAISYYRQAFELEPVSSTTWYFINNNLGYCLNVGGAYKAAEPYLRAAIQIDPDRYNAYKNLGISLQGQGDCVGAARAYVKATQADASDGRALRLLEILIQTHPEIADSILDIDEQLARCRQAVKLATQFR